MEREQPSASPQEKGGRSPQDKGDRSPPHMEGVHWGLHVSMEAGRTAALAHCDGDQIRTVDGEDTCPPAWQRGASWWLSGVPFQVWL